MRLIRLLIGMVIVFVLVLVAGLFFVPGEKIAQVAADELTRRTGREVSIAGKAHISLWPQLGVTVDALKIANADWSDNGPLFQAKSVTIGVDAAALFNKDIKIRALRADHPEVLLERNKDGVGNWELTKKATAKPTAPSGTTQTSAPAPSHAMPAFTLDKAEITNASVYFVDRKAGTEISQRDIDLTLAYPKAGGPADIDLTLHPNGETLRLKGRVEDALGFAAAKISTVAFDVTAPGAKGRFEGRASVVPEAQGKLSLDISDTAALTRALRSVALQLPEGLGRALSLKGDITYTRDGKLALRDATVVSGKNKATLAADLTTSGDRPRLNAQITAGALDLRPLTASGENGTAPGTPATGWSTAPIDASALAALDGEIAITAPSVDLGVTELGTTRLLVAIDRARAVTTLREVQAFGGTLTGEFVANNRSGLSVGGDLKASSVALQSLLTQLAGITRFSGDASARLKFLGSGQNLAAIMNSLSGDGSIDTGRGTIEGIDLDRLFRGGDPTGGTTIFDATNATFTMDKGVLANHDLLMKLAGIEARGDGTVDLGRQQLDYLFTPVSLKARDGRGLAIPVKIRGPWASPKISVDLEKAIQLNAAEEKKKVEEKVRQEVAKKLGLEQKEGESTEDAVKRTVEEEAVKGLLKLLSK